MYITLRQDEINCGNTVYKAHNMKYDAMKTTKTHPLYKEFNTQAIECARTRHTYNIHMYVQAT